MIVTVFSANELAYVLEVGRNDDTIGTAQLFEIDWDDCLNQVADEHPEDWHVSEVEQKMVELGWILRVVDSVEVSY